MMEADPLPTPSGNTVTPLGMRGPVLVTGYPGLVARLAVDALLEKGVDVVALEDDRIDPTLVGSLPPVVRCGALRIVRGRLSSIDLGLAGEELRELEDTVDAILHWANEPDPNSTLRHAMAIHADSTREVIRLAFSSRRLRLVSLWSSAWVTGLGQGVVQEQDFNPRRALKRRYDRSKQEAERLARAALPELPISILRPSVLFGHATTGAMAPTWPSFHLFRLFWTWRRTVPIPIPGSGHVPFNLVPVDYAVRAGLHLAEQSVALGRTLHITDPTPPTAREALDLIASWTGAKRPLSLPVPARLTAGILDLPLLRDLTPAQREFLDRIAQPIVLDAHAASAFLRNSGLHCPAFATYGERLAHAAKVPLPIPVSS